MSTSYSEIKGLLGGLLLTASTTLLLLVGIWQLFTLLGEHPTILLVAAGIGLLVIFLVVGVAIGRASHARQVQEAEGNVEAQENPVVDAGHASPQTYSGTSGTTLSVLKFDDPSGADWVLLALQGMQARQLISLEDAAVVSWPEDRKKPQTRQMSSMAGTGALGGAFWGFLFGLIFFIPLLGMAMGAAMGGLSGALADVGIDDDFIKQVREKVTPGTSALFVLTSGATDDRVIEELKQYDFEIISTKLPDEQEKKLRDAFAKESYVPTHR